MSDSKDRSIVRTDSTATTTTTTATQTDRLLTDADMAAITFTEGLPQMLVTLLERRYLTNLKVQDWNIAPNDQDLALPLLREVTRMGRPHAPGEWAKVMPQVLSACHEPGHALLMVVHGDGKRHHIYLGGKRIIGSAARSTDEYLRSQEGAFKAYFTGLELEPNAKKLNTDELPELTDLVSRAPALTALTGITAGRGNHQQFDWQSLDRLARAVGDQRYMLMVVAEPLEASLVDSALDACRQLRSEIHAYIRRTLSRTQGGSEGESSTASKGTTEGPPPALYIQALTVFLQTALPMLAIDPASRQLAGLALGAIGVGSMFNNRMMHQDTLSNSRQISNSKTWSDQGGIELLDANAEVCDQLLQQHIARLTASRSNGWWRTAVYIAAESDAGRQAVVGTLRSLVSGDATALDPIREIQLPSYLLRPAIERGQICTMRPTGGGAGHPLGAAYDALATCVSSEELSALINLPQQEIAGLPMRDYSDFAVNAPIESEEALNIGSLQDNMGHNLGPLALTRATLNRHCFVSGITGSGKTNTCMQILIEAYRRFGTPFLVIEPAKGEYRRLLELPEMRGKLRVYTIGDNSSEPFRLNPLAPMEGVPLGRHIDLLKAVFNASFPMYAGMDYVLEEALLDIYADRGWSLYDSRNSALTGRYSIDELSALTPNLADLHDQIDIVLARKKYGQEINQNMSAALRSRVLSLMRGNKGAALNTRRSIPLQDLFDSPAVIELRNLGDDEEKAFVMALLFMMLYEYAETKYQQGGRQEGLHHITLVEEAHRLLAATHGGGGAEVGDPRGKAVSMFTDMLAEMRAYGEGFVIADQIPTKLAPETLKNTNLKIVHRLVAPDDRSIAGECMNLNQSQIRYLNNLPIGNAVVHDERIGEAVLVRIFPIKHDIDAAEQQQVAVPKEQQAAVRQHLYRHAGCHNCPSPTSYFHYLDEASETGAELAAGMSNFLDTLLLDKSADGVPVAWQRWNEWRSSWLLASKAARHLRGKPDADASKGLIYCAAAQGVHHWLGQILAAQEIGAQYQQSRRAKPDNRVPTSATVALAQLTPEARTARERAARGLSQLISVWSSKVQLDDAATQEFLIAQERLQAQVTAAPPRELAGCAQCPTRCQMLPFIAPQLAVLDKTVAPKLIDSLPTESRLVLLRQIVDKTIPELAAQGTNPTAHAMLYCLATNLGEPVHDNPNLIALLDLLRRGASSKAST